MKKAFFVTCFLFSLTFNLFAQESEKRPMTVDDALDMVRVGDALISPDGNWVFFSKSELDWKKNERKKTYYKISAAGGEAYQYLSDAGGSDFEFSPQGTYLSFLRESAAEGGEKSEEKDKQIFLMRTEGGEAVAITKHKKGIRSYEWSQDESKLFFLADEPREEEEDKAYKDGYDGIFVDEGPNGQATGAWRNLWVFDLASKEEKKLTDENILIGSFDVSPDAGHLVFTARSENRRNQQNLSEIYILSVEDGRKTRLTENRAPEGDVTFAPDGKRIAYTAPDDKEWDLRNDKIWVMNPETQEYGMVSERFEGNIRNYRWTADGNAILFSGLVRTDSNLFKLDLASKKVIQVTHEDGLLAVSSFSKNRTKYVYTVENCDVPADLYVGSIDGGEVVRLTDANPWITSDLALASCEVLRWKSRDGLEIEGMFYLPQTTTAAPEYLSCSTSTADPREFSPSDSTPTTTSMLRSDTPRSVPTCGEVAATVMTSFAETCRTLEAEISKI